VPAALGTIVQVDHEAFYGGQAFLAHRPPTIESIDQEIAGLVAGGKKQERFAVGGFQNSARRQFFLGHHIMISRLDRLKPA